MRVISVRATNFASYKELEFDFTNQGLTLIQGSTGAGKSTLCDLIPWTLFGKTAKDGSVDEVLSWPGTEITISRLELYTSKGVLNITRKRGKPKDNDLYFYYDLESEQRGKDIPDTQRLLHELLGMDYNLYLSGAYYHEFSQTAQFFIATAKNRRAICEQLVDLSLAKTLHQNLLKDAKRLHEEIFIKKSDVSKLNSSIDTLLRVQESERTKATTWQEAQNRYKEQATYQYDLFEANRKKTISKKCTSCGTVLQHPHEVIDNSVNPYIQRLADLEMAVNPHTGSVKDYSTEIVSKKEETKKLTLAQHELEEQESDLELLSQVIKDYRSASILNTIKDVETKTNQLLTEYFDAEIRVSFDVADADKLEVSITKDGNEASYTQLSKGQRCLLKLSFGVAVMKTVANHHGLHFSQVFYDESLDGLDSSNKLKAVRMFEHLATEHESVFLVEHSTEVKSCVDNSYYVELINGGSTIEKA